MTANQHENWQLFESIGLRVVAALAERALAFYKNLPPTELKPDRSLVSAADRLIEQDAKVLLKAETPDFGFYGEEFGSSEQSLSDTFWMLDPIDGTSNFLSKVPTWSILLALIAKGRPRVGVAAFPALGEIFSAASGTGASFGPLDQDVALGKKPLSRCSGTKVETLRDAHVAYSSPAQFAFRGAQAFFQRLAFGVREFRTQADAFGYSRVLCGGIDAMIDMVAAPYDLAAIEVLFEETPGLQFSNIWGNKSVGSFGQGGAIAASTPALHKHLLDSLGESLLPSQGVSESLELGIESVELAQTFHRCLLRTHLKGSGVKVPESVTLVSEEKQSFQTVFEFSNSSSFLAAESPRISEAARRDTKLYGQIESSTWVRSVNGSLCEASLQLALNKLCDENEGNIETGKGRYPWKLAGKLTWKPLSYVREIQVNTEHWLQFSAFLRSEQFIEAVRKLVAEQAAEVLSLAIFVDFSTVRTISENGSDALKQTLNVQGYFEKKDAALQSQRQQLPFCLSPIKYERLRDLKCSLLAELRKGMDRA